MAHGTKPPALLRQLAEAGLISESDVAPPVLAKGSSLFMARSGRSARTGWSSRDRSPLPRSMLLLAATASVADEFERFRLLIVKLDNAFRQKQAKVIEAQYKEIREDAKAETAKPL
jgi:hypothetical protein